jgi:hypothetical protein
MCLFPFAPGSHWLADDREFRHRLIQFLPPELPARRVSGELADSVASRVRPALRLRLGKLDSRSGYVYRVCPDGCLNGTEKICISEMFEVKLCFVGSNVIEDRRNYKHTCTRFVASHLKFSRPRASYTIHRVLARRQYVATRYEVERHDGNHCVLLLGASTQAQP